MIMNNKIHKFVFHLLLLFSCLFGGMQALAGPLPVPDAGPGGPILVIKSPTSPFGNYYAEILRNEGFNAFAVVDIATVTPVILANYEVVILDQTSLSASQVTLFTDWVNAGGNLVAMRPDAQLASLLGLTATGTTLAEAYLLVDTSQPPGAGIVGQTIQFHGTADRYTLSGATELAALYSNATTPALNPAVTLRAVGSNGGQAAAFVYDLATSIVYTRQGNPAWAGQERDGFLPLRSDDLFYGASATDPQPDWVDLDKVGIPQADEQQRLLANLVLHMNFDKKPLPRFWYFPRGEKAVVIMTGDDHGSNGTAGRFDQFIAASEPGCSVDDWECVRGTSYLYWDNPLNDAQAAAYAAQGFEVGLHINTGCADYTHAQLETFYTDQISQFSAKYSSIPQLYTQRHHCIAWSGWATAARVELNHGMRLDTNYYYWPPGWVADVPGLFTGSGMPMRFADLDGTLIDVYQAVTQMTDESGQSYPFTINTLLDRALGPGGYYGAFTINAHTDTAQIPESDAVVSSALARGVPIVSSRQMLEWLDGRNSSSFEAISWDGSSLGFTVASGDGANGLQGLLPLISTAGTLAGLAHNGTDTPFTVDIVKGITYARFSSPAGDYVATYEVDTVAPTITAKNPADSATDVDTTADITASFSEAMDPASINSATFTLRDASNALVPATISYDPVTQTATLNPLALLAASTSYTATIEGADAPRAEDLSGNPLASDVTWSFTTGVGSACPCSAWGEATTPGVASSSDSAAVELGVKFRTAMDGYIDGVRFYKGSQNTGTHIGNLWTNTGQLLGSAVFGNETATGWQQVDFSTPIAVTAGTVYVASYFAPNGHYAFDRGYFADSGVRNGPVYLLQDGESGSNGVYGYNSSSTFPTYGYQASNYWVDVVFTPSAGPGVLNVVSTTPADQATGVFPGTQGSLQAISATFTNDLDAVTVTAASFFLKDTSDEVVPATLVTNGKTASLTPAGPLSPLTTYTATLTTNIADNNGTALVSDYTWTFTTAGSSGDCESPANPIVAENCLPGNPASEWDIAGEGDTSIQGFATEISVNRGQTVQFKIDTDADAYALDIYRMGHYQGQGARKLATVQPEVTLPQNQPACLTEPETGLIDCGNWAVSVSWDVPAGATSGIYFARAVRADTGGASHIFFIVRDDSSSSELLFQTSDTTWQAYNDYGGNSLYAGSPAGRAYKVSYNRPFRTRAVAGGRDWVFNAEYPMVRWLEANGYDVSYISGVDSDRRGALLLNHDVFLSIGHDEYWSGLQRSNVEAARDAGVHLAFFSGNEIFWKTRWESSIDGSETPYRTLVCYKETHANAIIDPEDPPTWTGTWRDPRFSPPADGGQPENALSGTIFHVNSAPVDTAIVVPEAEGKLRFWRNTDIATLSPGTSSTLTNGTLGYESDEDRDNGHRPPGLIRLSATTIDNASILLDYGSTYGPGTASHHMTLYRHASGALVFGAGTVQYAWGLDAVHDRGNQPPDVRLQQATVNLFADMGVQAANLQAGLVAASASSDATAPVSVIAAPEPGTVLPTGSVVTISGSASEAGGGVVGGVEVSFDDGASWHPATGRDTWSYNWAANGSGSVTIISRAVDDSGNLETPGAGVTVSLGTDLVCTSNCTIWPANTLPGTIDEGDASPVELGVKFTADFDGVVTGVRFYKAAANTGTHIGNLWTGSGELLASTTFVSETASGWQQENFDTPVSIDANTVYIISYYTPVGHYSSDASYFSTRGINNPPLHALQNGFSGPNGVYAYGLASSFPSDDYFSSNYWVDVVFDPVPTPMVFEVKIDGVAELGQILTGSYTYRDAEGDPEGASTYRWLRDGTEIAGATGTSYRLTIEDLGAVISFEVTPVAQTGESPGAAVASSGTIPVSAGVYGDINYDGKVDVTDVLIVMRIFLEDTPLSPAEMQVIDVAPLVTGVPDPDGEITVGDLLIIQRMAVAKSD
jgi:hypothetical protein